MNDILADITDQMSDISDIISDEMSIVLSDTISDTTSSSSCHSISEELQHDIQHALTEYQSIEKLHATILDQLNHLRESISDTIYITYDGYNKHEFDTILNEIYQEALNQVEATGHNPFGSMLLSAMDKAEFKYSTSRI